MTAGAGDRFVVESVADRQQELAVGMALGATPSTFFAWCCQAVSVPLLRVRSPASWLVVSRNVPGGAQILMAPPAHQRRLA
jgi:hypothetical protein